MLSEKGEKCERKNTSVLSFSSLAIIIIVIGNSEPRPIIEFPITITYDKPC